MTGVKSFLHKYVEEPGPNVVFGDNSSAPTEGYGSVNCNGIVFTRIAYVNGLKYNLISVSQLCDAKYIVQFDDKRGTIFNANKEVVLIAPRRDDVYVLDMSSLTQNGTCLFSKTSETINWLCHRRLSLISTSRASTTRPNRTKFWAFHPWCIPKTSLVLLVKKENTTGHHSKPNKPFPSKAACIFFIWTFLDLSVQCPFTMRSILWSLWMNTQDILGFTS